MYFSRNALESGNGLHAACWHRWAITAAAVAWLLVSCSLARSDEADDLAAALELSETDTTTIAPERVIEICSAALARKTDLLRAQVVQIYRCRGMAYVGFGNHRSAERDFNQALKIAPDNIEIKWHWANALANLGRLEDAIAIYKELMSKHPDYVPVYASAAALYFVKKGDVDLALDYANKALARDKDYAHAYHIRAQVFLVMGKFNRCLEDLTRVEELDPRGFTYPEQVYLLRGQALFGLGKYQQAAANYQLARRCEALWLPATTELYQLYLWQLRKYQLARILAEDMIRRDKHDPRGHCFLAFALCMLAKYDEARNAAERTVAVDPKFFLAYRALAAAYEGMEQYASAIKSYEKYMQLSPGNSDALATFAHLLATCPIDKLRDGRKALGLASRACEMTHFKEPVFLGALAEAHAECGNFSEAVRIMKQAISACDKTKKPTDVMKAELKLFEQGKAYHRRDSAFPHVK